MRQHPVNRSIAGNVPAASAVGIARARPLTVYCIASAHAPIALENPRQCSAWDYPPQYGPRSPTFARACIANDAAQTLFISGTASIVGHCSAHAGDQREQTREIVRNIRAPISAANQRVGARVLYLQADICRHDLLVEIEAVGTPEPL